MTADVNQQPPGSDRTQNLENAFLQVVLGGGGLPEIATQLAEAIGETVALVGRGGELLAGARTEGLSERSGSLASVRLTDDDQKVLVDGREVPCHGSPIRAARRTHGHVLVLEPITDTPQHWLAIRSAATAAALVLATRAEIVEHEQKYQSSFMYQLLQGSITEAGDALRRSELFGWDLSRRVIALVVRSDDPPREGALGDLRQVPLAVRSLVLSRDPEGAVVGLNDEVVVVTEAFPWENGVANALQYAQSLQQVSSRAYGASMSVGMSRPVTHVLEIPRAYDQAVTAFRVGRRLHGREVASHFSELGIDRVLSLVEDQEELNNFASDVLGELAGNGERSADLRRTLEVLLETNVNIAESARRLHYHYNTLRFRIDKLERIIGPFRDDPRVRLNAQMALLILRMRNPDT